MMLFLATTGMALAQRGMSEEGAFAGGQMVRGTVTAVAPDRLTVKTEEGEVYQVAVSTNTRVIKDRQAVMLGDVHPGDGVGAMGVMDSPTKTLHALFVAVLDAEQVKKAREELGKFYITGKVTAIDMDNARITVMRPDNVSQIIQADESTSFKRGRRRGSGSVSDAPAASDVGSESITLADVKVGDVVMGRGAMKNGSFVPAELRVMDATARGRRHGNGNGASNVSPSASGSQSPK
jgi:hypothetical protein